MESTTSRLRFEHSGYYFIGLVVLAMAGFWPTYFANFFGGMADVNFYFHFHVLMVSAWVACLIAQPILIRKKRLATHRIIGQVSYVVMPLLFISVILLTHYRMQDHVLVQGGEKLYGPHLLIPAKDLLILGTFYVIAIAYRKNIHIHARAMVATGIVFIEPALVRVIISMANLGSASYPFTIGLIYSLLVGLIFLERKAKQGKWVFPLVLGLYVFVHSVILLQIRIGLWESFATWFASLPLTS